MAGSTREKRRARFEVLDADMPSPPQRSMTRAEVEEQLAKVANDLDRMTQDVEDREEPAEYAAQSSPFRWDGPVQSQQEQDDGEEGEESEDDDGEDASESIRHGFGSRDDASDDEAAHEGSEGYDFAANFRGDRSPYVPEVAEPRPAKKSKTKKRAPSSAPRERDPMKQAQPTKKDTIFNEPPHDEILGIVERYGSTGSMVTLEIKRQTPGAQWASVRTITIPPKKVYEVGEKLRVFAGGGTFVFLMRDASTREQIAHRWRESFEGLPKPPDPNLTILYDSQTDQLVIGPLADSTSAGFSGMPGLATGALTAGYGGMGGGFPMGHGMGGMGAGGPIPGMGGPAFPAPTNDVLGRPLPPPDEYLPAWARSYTIPMQWQIATKQYEIKHGHPPSAGGGATSTDALAMYWVNAQKTDTDSARATVARLESKLEAVAASSQSTIMQLQQQIAAQEREIERERSKQATTLFEAKIHALQQQIAAPQKPSMLSPEALVALAPVLVACIQHLGSTSKSEQQMQLEQMRLMTQQNSKPQGPSEMTQVLGAMMPVLGPVLVQYLANQSPDKVADLRESNAMQNQIMLKMMMDFIMANQPADQNPPWWQEPLMGLFQTMGGVGSALLMRNQAQALPKTPTGLPSPAPQAGSVADAAPSRATVAIPQNPLSALDPLFAEFIAADPTAGGYTKIVFTELAKMGVDSRFFTHEWAVILYNLHMQLDPREMVQLFCDHLEHSRTFNLLPTQFEAVFEDPRKILGDLIRQLPIYTMVAPDYAEGVIEQIALEIEQREREYEDATTPEDAETDAIDQHLAQTSGATLVS